AVKGKKILIFIFDIPAGIDIKLRTIGTNLQINTALFPYLLNHLLAFFISSFFKPSFFPILLSTKLSIRSMFKTLPTLYNKIAPNTDPIVADTETFQILIVLNVVKNPPKVKTTSDGIGGNIFSIVINKKIPIYPSSFIVLSIKSSI